WKYCTSVSTERQVAPWAAYEAAISAGLKFSRMMPLEGEARFISAMTAGFLLRAVSMMALAKPRTSLRLWASRSRSDSLRSLRAAACSFFLVFRMVSRILLILLTSVSMRRILRVWRERRRFPGFLWQFRCHGECCQRLGQRRWLSLR